MLHQLSRSQKITLLLSLYFAQGLPFGFFTQALPSVMRELKISLELIGLSTLVALPWALKFIWAPFVDRGGFARLGRRRGWIIPLQFSMVAALLLLAFFPLSAYFTVVLVTVFLVNLLAATQDIATDGLAVDLLARNERGWANGIQVGGYRVGMVVGGGALLILYDHAGWLLTMVIMALLLALSSVPVLRVKEPAATTEPEWHPSLRAFFKRDGALPLLCLIMLYKLGDAVGTGMLRPFLVDLKLGLTTIGWLLGGVGFAFGLLGALLGGLLINRVGRFRALIGFGVLQTVALAAYCVLALIGPALWQLVIACAFEHLAGGMATAALFTCMMDWCSPEASGTDYTVQASAVVIATGLGAALSGFSAAALGYAGHFGLSVGLSALGIAAVWRLFAQTDRRMGRSDEVS